MGIKPGLESPVFVLKQAEDLIDTPGAAIYTQCMPDIESFFRTISSIAVIIGTILVVLQLRVNARQAKARNAFDLIGKVIDPTFPARRHLLYQVAEKHKNGKWSGFDRSLEDFEVRNFANIYEQLGLLVRKGVVDLPDVLDALSAQPMADWETFEPIRKHIMAEAGQAFPALAADQPGLDSIYWPNFKWLADESRKWTLQRVPGAAGAGTPPSNTARKQS